ncbi:MAG TPA: GNAT family N-acetyltransferase [Conexibacter sp.]|nr:GNAT family N-acetyltransferase [Conexibacter sp.]
MRYRLEPLTAEHDLDPFDSGKPPLDEWLRHHARNATGQGTRTNLLIDAQTDAVVGFFAIAPHLIARDEAPRSIGRGAPARIPAILLAKLALDQRLQGRGLGAELLIHALTTIITAARTAGGRIIVVDAIDDQAAAFYRAHDFQPAPSDPQRLVMKLSTAARALSLPWP